MTKLMEQLFGDPGSVFEVKANLPSGNRMVATVGPAIGDFVRQVKRDNCRACPSIDPRRCVLLRHPEIRNKDLDEDDECECMCHRNDGLGADDE